MSSKTDATIPNLKWVGLFIAHNYIFKKVNPIRAEGFQSENESA